MSWKTNNEKGKYLYTFLIHELTANDVILRLRSILEKVNLKMKDNFKKKIINERLYNIILELETLKESDKINHIILSGKEVNMYKLTNDELKILKKWNINQFYYSDNNIFELDYLKALFDESKLKIIGEFDGNKLCIIELDNVKSRQIDEIKISNQEEFNKYYSENNIFLFHGKGTFIKKIKTIPENRLYTCKLKQDEITEAINKIIIETNQIILNKEVLTQLINPSFENLFLFGKKEVSNGILGYQIKKLFITQKLLDKLKSKIDNSLLNFEIIIVDRLKSGDIGDEFIRNYGGLIGIKYYA